MTRINLIREESASCPVPVCRTHLRLCMLTAVTLAVVHVALGWRLAALAERRDAVRLAIARRHSAALRHEAKPHVSTPPADDPVGPGEVGRRLRAIAAAEPPDLWLLAYDERRGEVTMYGMTSDETAPRAFVENLTAALVFARVEIIETLRQPSPVSSRLEEAGSHEFRLKAVRRAGLAVENTGDFG